MTLGVSILLGCYALRSLFASYYVGKEEETQAFISFLLNIMEAEV